MAGSGSRDFWTKSESLPSLKETAIFTLHTKLSILRALLSGKSPDYVQRRREGRVRQKAAGGPGGAG